MAVLLYAASAMMLIVSVSSHTIAVCKSKIALVYKGSSRQETYVNVVYLHLLAYVTVGFKKFDNRYHVMLRAIVYY